MGSSYEIKLDADETDLDRVIDRSFDKLDRLEQKAAAIDIGGSGYSGGSGGGRGGLLSDPWSRHEDASTDLWAARSMGLAGEQVRPYELAEAKAQRAVLRANQMLSDTPRHDDLQRDSGGLGFMALAARLLTPAAALAYAGSLGIKAGLASREDIGSAYWAGGGTPGETAGLSSLGGFLGRSAADSAGAAVRFGDALHNSSYGAGYFRSRGIVDFGGLTTDKDKNYLSAARQLANEPDRSLATRVARDTGLQDELWLRDLDPSERDRALGGMSDDMSDLERRKEARFKLHNAEFHSFINKAYRTFVDLTVGTAIDAATQGGRMAEAGEYRAHLNHAREEAEKRGVKFDKEKFDRETDNRGRPLPGHGSQSSGEAVPQQIRTTPGISGGGPRSQSALPPGARAQQLDENLRGYGRYLGGYT